MLALAGFMQSLCMVTLAVLLLRETPDKFRGRVMGVRMLVIYSLPLGLLAAGALIERIGFPATATLYSLVGLTFTLLIALRWRADLRKADTPASGGSPPPRGGRTERHGLSSPIATVRQTPTGELSPMAFLVGVVSSRAQPVTPTRCVQRLRSAVALRGNVGDGRSKSRTHRPPPSRGGGTRRLMPRARSPTRCRG